MQEAPAVGGDGLAEPAAPNAATRRRRRRRQQVRVQISIFETALVLLNKPTKNVPVAFHFLEESLINLQRAFMDRKRSASRVQARESGGWGQKIYKKPDTGSRRGIARAAGRHEERGGAGGSEPREGKRASELVATAHYVHTSIRPSLSVTIDSARQGLHGTHTRVHRA